MPEPLKAYAELQIGLDRERADAHEVELRFMNPLSETEQTPVKGEAHFDAAALMPLERKPVDYGRALAGMLFADPAIKSMFLQVKSAVETANLPLRVRLLIGAAALELHSFRWELLTGPDSDTHLFTSDRVLFSRFITNADWSTVRLRPKADVTALIAVSAPNNCDEFGLAPVDLEGEIARATEQLGGFGVTVAGKAEPLTLARLIDRLREPVDILYLVCHGAFNREGPRVFLQAEDGTVATVKGKDLADRLGELPQQPRLVVLASCESAGAVASAGEPGSDALHSLAPLLAQAGVPAIVAMRGKISMDTVKQVMPIFFRELVVDGQVDRALAVARAGAIAAGRPDFWMMALYLRLRGGRIWYEPGFGGVEDFDKWESILNHVRRGRFVAIIGSGVGESFFGDSRNLAEKLAQSKCFPLASYLRDDLPQVLQYLDLKWDRATVIGSVRQQLRDEVLLRQGARIPPELKKEPLARILDSLMETKEPKNTYQILADLPGAVYVSAMPDRLMARALKLAGKNPTVLYANWRKSDTNIPKEPEFNGTETPATPVVYQMLGVFGKDEYAPENESLVLTENDYFDYMISTARYGLVPRVVRSALVENSLLFLGFQLTDWSFRVLFRLIQSLEGSSKSANMNMSHVGVQVNPDEYSLADVKEARHHLERYFSRARIALFWGSAEDFLRQLQKRIESAPALAMTAAAQNDGDEF